MRQAQPPSAIPLVIVAVPHRLPELLALTHCQRQGLFLVLLRFVLAHQPLCLHPAQRVAHGAAAHLQMLQLVQLAMLQVLPLVAQLFLIA
jgi:hypothetical protein